MTTRNIGTKILHGLANPAWVCFTWFGMTAGISMLATPLRFSTPSVTRSVALDLGRVVFSALNTVELVALIILLITVRVSHLARRRWWIVVLLAFVLVAQSAWLLPELAERAQQIAAGVEPPDSIAHAAYSTLELAKLSLLLALGFATLSDRATITAT